MRRRISAMNAGKTILLVEDNDAVRASLGAVLEIGGYNVLLAMDGSEAVEIVSKSKDPIHLLITDVVMPRLSGVVLARQLQQQRSEMKVLFMTGYNRQIAIEQYDMSEKANFLQKPISMDQILQTVTSLLVEKD